MNKKGFGSKDEIKEIAEKVWEELKYAGAYLFPKAHSTSYSIIANATQFLKVHYPTEFFCSLLRQATDEEYGNITNISKKNYGVKFIMPEINTSKEKFVIHNDKIVFSFESLKGIGVKAAIAIVENQPYKSMDDFFVRVNKRVVNVKVVRVLITAKVFRKFGGRNKMNKQYLKLRKDDSYVKKTKEEWDAEAASIITYARKSIKTYNES